MLVKAQLVSRDGFILGSCDINKGCLVIKFGGAYFARTERWTTGWWYRQTQLTTYESLIEHPCSFRQKHGEAICIDGYIWVLSHSEMGPPDQRQMLGPCRNCRPEAYAREHKEE